jgi:hypothetical protein
LLEKYKTDLVLSGHSHSNERSYLIRGHYENSLSFNSSMMAHAHHSDFVKQSPYNGTVYAICGTSGQDPDPPQPDAPMPCMYFSDFATNASLVIDVNGNLLTGRYLSASETVIDSFSITKKGPAVPPDHGNASCEISVHPSGDTITIYFTLYLAHPLGVKTSLVDMNGKTVQTFTDATKNLGPGYHTLAGTIDRSVAGNGVYIAVVHAGDQQFTKKFIIGN